MDAILKRLDGQWLIETDKIHSKRMDLLRLLREVGKVRLQAAVLKTIDEYQGQYCPPVSFIRARVPLPPDDESKLRHSCPQCHDGWIYSRPDEMGNSQVKRCPNQGRTEYQVSRRQQFGELARERAANPDEFFSEADVKVIYYAQIERQAKNQPPMSFEEAIKFALEARKVYRAERSKAPQSAEKRDDQVQSQAH